MLTVNEVANQLSIREFVTLCAAIDEKYKGVSTMIALMHGDGSKYQMVDGIRKQMKFSVLEIERMPHSVRVAFEVNEEILALEICVNPRPYLIERETAA